MSLWRWRTSCVAFLTAFLNRDTKSSRNGVTATAISVKSKFSQNIRPSIPTIVRMSTKMPRVAPEAKFWIVVMSVVMVRQEVPGLLRVVVAEREAVEVVVDPQPQVVGDVLADALGVVVVDVRRDRAEDGDDHDECRRHGGEAHLVIGDSRPDEVRDPVGHRMVADDAVENDLQGPRPGQAHRRLDQHRGQDDHEPAPIGPQQLADEPGHSGAVRHRGLVGLGHGWGFYSPGTSVR